ncbi:PilC/PilY family type IV pilus protein [Neptuniibacter sp.]|uniref:PilC/PilY family type IV pilus protein n=1 Tax=Neptuniibacter sp. TaxID=1962643 RepID=UPI0026167287|nr:PilC/PilY family type IV pilus protein [Neptuniibacter sp.]MCP4598357.1 hypothetical protein [Neptuniibacter sp.]
MRKSIKSVVYGFLLAIYSTSPVWADDTEIFFGGTTSVTVRPNILFVLDTSGSMSWDTSGTRWSTDDGPIRIDEMKTALRTILSSVQDVNVGLMRFHVPGGPILYPVTNVDENLTGYDPINGSSRSQISSSFDDAEERSDGTVVIDGDELFLMSAAEGGEDVSVPVAFERSVLSNSDDAFEIRSGNKEDEVKLSSNRLHIPYRNGNNNNSRYKTAVGVRFTHIDIPQNATINSASIDFVVAKKRSGTPRVDIYGEDSDSPASFSSSDNDITDRDRTSAKVDWTISSNPNDGGVMSTPDISSLVSEIVSRDDWDAQDEMAFIFLNDQGSSDAWRQFATHDHGSYDPALLKINYSAVQGPVTNSIVALRFNNVQVPQGAEVTSATVSFPIAEDSSVGGYLTFRAEDVDNSSSLSTSNGSISGKATTSASVGTSILSSWTAGELYNSPNLASVVEEVTDRSDWCGGNSLTILIEGADATKLMEAYDKSATGAVLDIEYDVNSVSSTACIGGQQSVVVDDGNDDVEERSSTLYPSDTEIQLGVDESDNSQKVGLRFNNIRLNQDATISSAYIEFAVVDLPNLSLPANLTIKIENSDNAAAFTAIDRPSNRSTLSSSVSWTINSGWDQTGQIYQSPDLSTLIESIVSRSGWTQGNSLAFVIEGSGRVEAASQEGSTLAPKLVINASSNQFDISTQTVRQELIDITNGLNASGNTPIVDALFEAASYYKGAPVKYGLNRGNDDDNPENHTSRVSHSLSYTGGTVVRPSGCNASDLSDADCADEYISGSPNYISPITETCQKNYIVMLTDGAATYNDSADDVMDMTGLTSCDHDDNDEECGPEILEYLSGTDQSGLSGDQVVKTYTIGFNFSSNWLRGLATAGQGGFYEASNSAQLVNVFDDIIKSIKSSNTSFSQPGITINQFNRLSHREDIYFSLFKPLETEKWFGNLKKYRLDGASGTIKDALDVTAIDPDSGFFSVNARSFWSNQTDGSDVELGGAAEKLPNPDSRSLYTYTGSYPVPASGLNDLTHDDNRVHEDNSDITKAMLGISSYTNSYRENLLEWTRGEDDQGNNRKAMGDPLHSIPILMTYSYDIADETYDSTVFVGTNEGFIHAIDTETGVEQFAFIPKELLGNLNRYYTNAENTTNRAYGMDGGLTIIAEDGNNDSDYIDTNDDYVWLFAGMRRGGRNYYALDVTDRSKPELKWVIRGGSGGTTGFGELGYSWSKPKPITINYDGTNLQLLLFAGGYDPSQDTNTTRSTDTMGRAIYMVDPDTGELFWSAGISNAHDLTLADMNYSIPSDVNPIDINNDGKTDQLYVGDMGGQVWRFDINNGAETKADLVTGGVIADLSVSSSTVNNRRFYYPPDISLNVSGSNRVLAIGIGSGWRASPLNTEVQDRYYVIKEFDHIFEAPQSYTKLTESDLYDATYNLIAEGDESEKEDAIAKLSNGSDRTAEGWYIRLLNSGEKVLAASLTVNSQIIFVTYEPKAPDEVTCEPKNGTSRAYLVKVLTAEPVSDITGDGNLNKTDRIVQLEQGTIPATPKLIDPETGAPGIWIGTEGLEEADVGKLLYRTYWREKTDE